MAQSQTGTVHAAARSSTHHFSKEPASAIMLLQGLGVEGDCHAGEPVQHRSRLKLNPLPPNLRQVHLIALESLRAAPSAESGPLEPGQLGENITTPGIDLCNFSRDTRLVFVAEDGQNEDSSAVVKVTGLRNPCPQIDDFRAGLKDHFLIKDGQGRIVGRTAGVMGVVERGGEVRPGMVTKVLQPVVHEPLELGLASRLCRVSSFVTRQACSSTCIGIRIFL